MQKEKAFCLKHKDLPTGWSKQALHFINKCVQKDPKKRIGHSKGITELKSHPWFKGFNWDALASRKMRSPFTATEITPKLNKKSEERKQREAKNKQEYDQCIKIKGHVPAHKAFKDFYYNIEEDTS